MNEAIVVALQKSQDAHCPKKKREEKISQHTRSLMQERRELRSSEHATREDLSEKNKQVSNAIRRDVRNHRSKIIKERGEQKYESVTQKSW